MASRQQVSQAMAILIAAYPNAKIIPGCDDMPGTIDVYLEMLQDLEPGELMQAVKYCIQTMPNFLPSVSAIRDAANRIKTCKSGGEISGQEAWGCVLQAIKDYGLYKAPKFSDGRISQAVRCIGWREICLSDEQDPAIRSQFIKAFEAIACRENIQAQVLQLESRQCSRAFALIGNTAKKLEK